jgi:dinuclear metal center YbgI/SA1388 family protein
MRIYDVISYLENKFPISSQAGFDNCGVQVGDVSRILDGVLIALDCTEEIIDEAIEMGANLIIAHHPLIFKPLKSLTGKNYIEKTLLKAIENKIVIYAIHTNLDHHMSGVNAEIARRIGVINPQILLPSEHPLLKINVYVPVESKEQVLNALFSAGAGAIGDYTNCSFSSLGNGTFQPGENTNPYIGEKGKTESVEEIKLEVLSTKHQLNKVIQYMFEAHPYEEVAYDVISLENQNQYEGTGMIGELEDPIDELTFLAMLKQRFHCNSIRHTNLLGRKIKSVAFCGGSGSFLLKNAIQKKADIYITGDFKYHEFFDAEDKIVIADIGHYESEQFTSDLIYAFLNEKFVNFAIRVTKVNTNPINYF